MTSSIPRTGIPRLQQPSSRIGSERQAAGIQFERSVPLLDRVSELTRTLRSNLVTDIPLRATAEEEESFQLIAKSIGFVVFGRMGLWRQTHEARSRMVRSFGDVLRRIYTWSDPDDAQSYAKYWGNRWLARALGDQVPFDVKPRFESLPLFSGALKLYVRGRLGRRDVSFFYSLSQAKRGWGPLSDRQRDQALRDHAKSLGGPCPELDNNERKYLDEAIRIVLRGRKFSSATFQPSTHGYVGAPQGRGGAAGFLARKGLRPSLPSAGESKQHYLVSLNDQLEEYYRRCRKEYRARLPPGNQRTGGTVDTEVLTRRRRTEVVALPEPGKFRLISKGDPLEYTLLQPLQGFLLSIWHDCHFSTMRGEDLGPRLAAMKSREFWNNGDYSKATDFLSSEASWYVLQRICHLAEVPSWLWDMGVGSLLSNDLHYPAVAGEQIPITPQTNGQLMGHPLSFPLLCIINLATFLYATAFRPRNERRDCLINGDDIAFPCDYSEFSRWKGFAAGLGLSLSPGKSYLSKDYALINSQLYEIRRRQGPKRHGYLNLKLVLGSSLKGGQTNARQVDISRSLNEMFENARWTAQCSSAGVSWSLANYLRPYAATYVPGINWFIPAHRGGLGIDRKFAVGAVLPTRWQRKLAGATFMDPSLSLSSGIRGNVFEAVVGVIGTPRPWAHRDESQASEEFAVKRQAVWEAWFARLSADISVLLGVSQTEVRTSYLLRRWLRAAFVAEPCAPDRVWEAAASLRYPILPSVLQRGLGLRLL